VGPGYLTALFQLLMLYGLPALLYHIEAQVSLGIFNVSVSSEKVA